ncbi:serine hydrolase [Collinsella sp. zg1085]|uniref:D-alanyl-D-alanine carboxypeptidase family protein n=1 Tax=Collinsella sp. zg1085 TaxID=2844380 RepID=UPI001C0E690A|nr:serine hydrolase [Collinsella sp. zg1085]QWT17452.1 serine hydrolase [Collinsella sp. zg1085]
MRRFATYMLVIASFLTSCMLLPNLSFAERLQSDVIVGRSVVEGGFTEADTPSLTCPEAIVVGKDGTVYFERAADTEVKIASITKVMTAIVALEHAALDDTVVVDEPAAKVGQSSAELRIGDKLSLQTALKALLMASGNDAAMAIATSVGKKIDPTSNNPYASFIDAMNAKAQELGMVHTLFENPHGLDFDGWEGNMHSSARDVATMFAYAMQRDDFRALEEDSNTVITVEGADGAMRDISLIDRNKIRGQEGNIGGKTGGTYIALDCFVGAFTQELGGEIYTVVLGSPTEDERWDDTRALAAWYYQHMVLYPLLTSRATAADGTPLVARVAHAGWSDKTVGATIENPTQAVPIFSLADPVEEELQVQEVTGAVHTGDSLGTLKLRQGQRELAEVEVVAAENQDGPNLFEWLLVQFDRALRFITGKQTTAMKEQLFEVPSPLELDQV